MFSFAFAILVALLPQAAGHASIWHPSMFGFNVTDNTFPYDNRPVSPLSNMPFSQWWFHNHLDYPPNPGDIFILPAGENVTTEIACNKGATSFFASSEGGDIRDPSNPNDPCPGSPISEFHTTGIEDTKGCALAISYKSDAKSVQPEDFAVFSVNQTCVWTRFTDFQVPVRMPPCPEGGCTCAFFWIHSADSGGEQNYMNGFKCNVTSSTSSVPIAKSQVPRRCGADPANQVAAATPGNCTYGAKQPFYWFNQEQNNMFEGTYSPPFYLDLYNFLDGAQNDIFEDSYVGLPIPGPNQTAIPILADLSASASSAGISFSTGLSAPTSTACAGSPLPNNMRTCGVTTSSQSNLTARSNVQTPTKFRSVGLFGMRTQSRRLHPGKRSRLWHFF